MTDVVITGIGAATPLGVDIEEITQSLRIGKSGIRFTDDDQFIKFPVHHAGYVDYAKIQSESVKADDYKLFILSDYAAKMAFQDAEIDLKRTKSLRMGCLLGTEPPAQNLISIIEPEGSINSNSINYLKNGLHPYLLLSQLALRYGFSGTSYLHLGTCSASAQAIGESVLMLKEGRADLMICGGVSSRVDPLSMLRLARVGALANTDGSAETLSRPFDKERTGFTMGEGAVYFILERKSEALARGKKPHAQIIGYGAALDGHSITDPHPDSLGMIISMERAIADSGIEKNLIKYINAHGTSTPKNDYHETQAIKHVFGDHAYNLSVSSTKSMHGHLMSAAGAMEALCSIIALKNGFIPPTINYRTPDPECDLNYTPNQAIDSDIRYALSNSFGLGGQNASLLFSRVDYEI